MSSKTLISSFVFVFLAFLGHCISHLFALSGLVEFLVPLRGNLFEHFLGADFGLRSNSGYSAVGQTLNKHRQNYLVSTNVNTTRALMLKKRATVCWALTLRALQSVS